MELGRMKRLTPRVVRDREDRGMTLWLLLDKDRARLQAAPAPVAEAVYDEVSPR